MTSHSNPTTWVRAVRPALRTVLAAWREITWKELRTTMLLGVGLFVYHLGTGLALGAGLRFAGVIFVADQVRALALLLAIAVADRVTGKDPDRHGAYAIATVLGAAVGAVASVYVARIVVATFTQHVMFGVGFVLYVFFDLAMLAGAAVWVMNDRRRAQRARDRMHAAELGRVAAEKRSIESDLQAMQARVEPQFLFNTLAQVHDLYRADAARGEHMLDELIAYLRAAMPRMRDTSSTVGQELGLVSAYLGIVSVRLGGRLAFEIAPLEASVAEARVPPMMLLPLVDHAIARGFAAPKASGSLRLRAEVARDRIRLEIADSGVGFLPANEGDGIAGIRERLAALYEERASLVLAGLESGATGAVLEIPVEVAAPHEGDAAMHTQLPPAAGPVSLEPAA